MKVSVAQAAPGRAEATVDVAESSAATALVFGRFGLLLTGARGGCTSSAWSGRGMAADPNRVPWGNMYEFMLTGTFVVVALYLLLLRKLALAWLAPIVVAFAIAS